jgi:hypothetical protein
MLAVAESAGISLRIVAAYHPSPVFLVGESTMPKFHFRQSFLTDLR